ncbi:MAG TPA: carboxypeptidase-like regulatory domain-containing protein [Candidatus Limnocylindria bacterium]|nr:carboxypeptidase-like regulatory domain-containing protein [Candidatus Limnocylindria bacterium]
MTALLLLVLAACTPSGGSPTSGASSASGSEGATVAIAGVVTAGPTCPVVTQPPDPACADRPVDGAVIRVLDGDGRQVAEVTSAADGSFELRLVPGDYVLVPQPVDGLMGTASEQELRVPAAGLREPVSIAYDTGIR